MSVSTTPPLAPRRAHAVELLGTVREDPYAWLRDAEDPETASYLASEREWYDGATAALTSLRDALYDQMAARTSPTERSVSWRRGECVYWMTVPQGSELPRFCRRAAESPQGSPAQDVDAQVLVDLAEVAAAGGSTYAELGVCEVSPDGRWLAYSVDLDGDEVYVLRFRDLDTGVDLPDTAPRTYYGGAWSADSGTFFYTVHDDAYRPHEVWRHRLGAPVADDVLVIAEDDAHFELEVQSSRSGAYVVISAHSRDTTETWLVPTDEPTAPPRSVQARRAGIEYQVEHAPWTATDGPRDELLIVTNDGAPEFRLVVAPTSDPGAQNWAPVLDGDPLVRVAAVDAFAGHYVLTLRRDGAPLLRVVSRDGSVSREIHPDTPAGTVALGTNEEFGAEAITVSVEDRTTPTVWWDVPLDGGARRERHRREVPSFDPSRYESHRVWFTAADGVRVPVIVVCHVDTPLDGTAPCLLYGYGAYEYTYEPVFSRTLASLLDRGVVFAHPGVRGGGEMGRTWWEQGRLLHKRTTFTDFAQAADALAQDGELGLVDGARIVGRGGSAGGLLQGAVYSLFPGRWRGLVAEVPFVDCINSMLDASLPLTVAEWDEWGDPHRQEFFDYMRSYTPYENLPDPGERPALLATGAVHDPRVLVHEPAKWVAALRHSDPAAGVGSVAGDPTSAGTVLFRVETGEGSHSGPAGRYAALHYEAEVQAWILTALGLG